jgi:hypothetical protein
MVALVRSRDDAVRLGEFYNQLGVYHLGGEGFVEAGGTGEVRDDLPPISGRLEGIEPWR